MAWWWRVGQLTTEWDIDGIRGLLQAISGITEVREMLYLFLVVDVSD